MGEKMGFYEVFLIGVGLSMDAFAASICKGLNMKIMKKYTRHLILSTRKFCNSV